LIVIEPIRIGFFTVGVSSFIATPLSNGTGEIIIVMFNRNYADKLYVSRVSKGEAAGIARNNKAAYPDRRVTRT